MEISTNVSIAILAVSLALAGAVKLYAELVKR